MSRILAALSLSLLVSAVACKKDKPQGTSPPADKATTQALTPTSATAVPVPAPQQVALAPTGPAKLALGKAPTAPLPLADYFKVRRLGRASISHDEKWLAYESDQSGQMNLWVAPLEGGPAKQLTDLKGYVHSFSFSPTADALVYEADALGNELTHLYLTASSGGPGVDLTPLLPKGSRVQFLRWSPDGKRFVYLSSARDPRFMDLYEYELAAKKATKLWESSVKLTVELASRDLQRFIMLETLSDSNSNLYLWERGGKEPLLLTPHQGDVLFGSATFSHDGKTLYLLSDEGGEFSGLYAMDLATQKAGPGQPARAKTPTLNPTWDVDAADFSKTGRYFWTLTNVDGDDKLEVREAATQKPITLPAHGGPGVLKPVTFSVTDRYLVARLVSDTTPVALYVVDLEKGSVRRVEDPLPPTLQGRKLVDGRIVRIKSFDGRDVPAFLYAPPGPGPFPAIIDVHGGPTAQSKRGYSSYRQYFISKGYVVLVPNVRGSTGYGKTYTRLDNMDLGGGPLKDIVACKQWLAQNAGVDPDRVMVMGGSYGGYMALVAATLTPKEFAANVDLFGPSDLKTLVESFPAYWAAFATFIYKKFGDAKNPAHAAYQRERSPVNFLDRVERPLLVVQGKNDPRVLPDQSQRVVKALRARKVPVHYLELPDEGHGFTKTANIERVMALVDRFFDRYVWGDTSVKVD